MNHRMAGDTTPAADYDQDFLLWLDSQAELLRARQFELLDLDHLIEEIDAMAGSLHRELRSRIDVILLHLLKCEYQAERLSDSWMTTLAVQRVHIFHLLEQNPSLRRRVEEYARRMYPHAVSRAAKETKLLMSTFPKSIPFSVDEILDDRSPPP